MAYIIEPSVVWSALDAPSTLDVASKIIWDSAHPLEIVIVFAQAGDARGGISWKFSRDLITEAAENGTAGLGDVQVTIDACAQLVLRLQSPHGTVRLRTGAAAVLDFIGRTLKAVDRLTEAGLLPLTDSELREAMLDWGLF